MTHWMNKMVLSYSSLNEYHVCPRRFWHKYILRDLPEEEKTQAQLDGTAAHEALRKRVALREPLPVQFESYEPFCGALMEQSGNKHAELKLGMMEDGKPCDFFDSGVWLRGALDFVLMSLVGGAPAAFIADWKTWKQREDAFELSIQALLLRTKFPEFKLITGVYIWLKDLKVGSIHHRINDTDTTIRNVRQHADSIKRRQENNDWPPDQGPLCGWCPVTKEMCEFKR